MIYVQPGAWYTNKVRVGKLQDTLSIRITDVLGVVEAWRVWCRHWCQPMATYTGCHSRSDQCRARVVDVMGKLYLVGIYSYVYASCKILLVFARIMLVLIHGTTLINSRLFLLFSLVCL